MAIMSKVMVGSLYLTRVELALRFRYGYVVYFAYLFISILGRLLLHVIDYQNGSGSLLQLQLQSQLLTDGIGKGKRAIRIRRAAGPGWPGPLRLFCRMPIALKLSVKS